MGYEAFMDGNGDVEGDYTLVALNPLDASAPGTVPIHRQHQEGEN